MRPIKLAIKGLNSFIEEQTIDFEKLTDRGLFGIFGPTGSGKSTILDGITLALYGDIARKSSNFINTNCNDLNVSYTFQISDSTNRIYVVNRQFRRDKKTGNAKTHAASVRELTADGEEVLADSATSVNKVCREILGLSLEDFTRTVVLPQGKFSEFLKLEGKQRREMLERLFNLQDYGERLAQKLSHQMSTEREKSNQLIGELSTYEEISEDKLKEEKKRLEEVTQKLEELKNKQMEVEVRYKEGEEVWKLQKELSEYMQNQRILESQAERMKSEEEKMKQGESALSVYPYMEKCEKKKKELEHSKVESITLENAVNELAQKKQKIEIAFDKIKRVKEDELPLIKAQSQQVLELIQDNKKVIELEMGVQNIERTEAGIKQIVAGLKKVQRYIEVCKVQENTCNMQLTEVTTAIEKAQKDEQVLKVEQTVRDQVNEGVKLTQNYELEKKNYEKNVVRQKELQTLRAEYEASFEQIKIQFEQKSKALEESLTKQETLLKHPPIQQEDFLSKQEALALAKEKWQRLGNLNKELEAYLVQNKTYEVEYRKIQVQVDEKKEIIERLKETMEKAKLENLVHSLRLHLHEGECCPVCGSKEYPIQTLSQSEAKETTKLSECEALLKEAEQELDVFQKALTEVQTQLSVNKVSIERLQKEQIPLMSVFEENNLEAQEKELLDLLATLQRYDENKRHIEEQISSLREEKSKIETESKQKQTLIEENQKQLVIVTEELESETITLRTLRAALDELGEAVGMQDFTTIYEAIKIKDQQREELLKRISEQSEIKQKLLDEKEKVHEKHNSYRVRFQRGLATFDAKQKSKQEFLLRMGSRMKEILEVRDGSKLQLQVRIKELLAFLNRETFLKAQLKGEVSYESIMEGQAEEIVHEVSEEELIMWYEKYPLLGEVLNILMKKLKLLNEVMESTAGSIENEFIQIEAGKNAVDADYEKTSKKLLEIKMQIQGLDKQIQEDVENLEQKLREENLTEEEVKKYLLTKEQIESLRQNINQYKEDCAKLIGVIGAVQNKLGERKLEAEAWHKLQEEKQVISNEVLERTKQHINLTTLVRSIEEALARLGKLREEKQKIDHKMAILTDLDKLFKGKRFVEFVAATRLKYVSLEASKKLKEITNGNYGLEVDENGKFIIRDYKNGGAQRDVSTLSGGETFLASLALALALSAEIQLKGTAPLELFFLDEGFGTLDDDLLEVVMTSLEKIHHDKLKVGIISHVEAIKNRVPVKLLLTPAESGCGGTKVKLERS